MKEEKIVEKEKTVKEGQDLLDKIVVVGKVFI